MGAYATAVLQDAPIVWWRNSSDSSGNGNDGTAEGTIQFQSSGPLVGQGASPSIAVEGAGGIVALASDTLKGYLVGRTSVSLECWVKFTVNDSVQRWVMGWGAPGEWGFFVQNGSVSWVGDGTAGDGVNAFNDGTWYHIVVTFDAGTVLVYVNGALDTSDTATSPIPGGEANDRYSAMLVEDIDNPGQYTEFYTGSMAEIAVYPQALSAGRVLYHYNAGINNLPAAGAGSSARNWFMQGGE